MESTIDNLLPDSALKTIIGSVNEISDSMVNLVKKHANENHVTLTPSSCKILLSIDQKTVNKLFLMHLEDDTVRPTLLAMGAQVNVKKANGRNCLWFTTKPELLRELLARGATLERNDTTDSKDRITDLLFNIHNNINPEENILAASTLLEHYKDVNLVTNPARYLLHNVAQCPNHELAKIVAELLCKYQALVNLINESGATPLMVATENVNTAVMQVLLINQASPDLADHTKLSPLQKVLRDLPLHSKYTKLSKETTAAALLLIQYKANPNQLYPITSRTPLHIAALCSSSEIIKTLLSAGADKTLTDYCNAIPYDLSDTYHSVNKMPKEITYLLMPDKDKIISLLWNIHYQENPQESINAAAELLASYPDINHLINPDQCLLHNAAECPNHELATQVTKLLCEHKAPVNSKNKSQKTPLIIATNRGYTNVMQILLEHQADPNIPDKNEMYPLHIALPYSTYCYPTIIPDNVVLLLKHNADPNKRYPKQEGHFPLHVAVFRLQPQLIKSLIEHKADKSLTNHEDKTAFNLAQPLKTYNQLSQEVVNLLMPDNPEEVLTFTTLDYVDPTQTKNNNNNDNTNNGLFAYLFGSKK